MGRASRPPDIENLLKVLDRWKVDYILVGSVAAAVYGVQVEAGDMDVVPSREHDNLEKLIEVLAEIEATPLGPFGEWNLPESGEWKWIARPPTEQELADWRPDARDVRTRSSVRDVLWEFRCHARSSRNIRRTAAARGDGIVARAPQDSAKNGAATAVPRHAGLAASPPHWRDHNAATSIRPRRNSAARRLGVIRPRCENLSRRSKDFLCGMIRQSLRT